MRTMYIADDGMEFESFCECKRYEKELERQKEEERALQEKALSDEFLLSVGFDVKKYPTELEKNQALSITWLIFDHYGNSIGLKTSGGGLLERYGITCDFRYVSGDNENDPEIMENWLRENKLYGHALECFAERTPAFYEMPLIEKLENLCWDVGKGKLINTAW